MESQEFYMQEENYINISRQLHPFPPSRWGKWDPNRISGNTEMLFSISPPPLPHSFTPNRRPQRAERESAPLAPFSLAVPPSCPIAWGKKRVPVGQYLGFFY